MANLYYDETLTADDCVVGGRIAVTGEEARHAVQVSRLRVGEQTLVGNGHGLIVRGEVIFAAKDRFEVSLTEITMEPRPAQQLVLVQALAKGDRDERAVEQATELGADVIHPWAAHRSVSRWNSSDKVAKGVLKWRRIAREASKQSLRPWKPSVGDLLSTASLCNLAKTEGHAVIVLHPSGEHRLSALARESWLAKSRQVVVVVGPEGGIDESELASLRDAGATVASLGSLVLRTSSAGAAGLTVLNVGLGRW